MEVPVETKKAELFLFFSALLMCFNVLENSVAMLHLALKLLLNESPEEVAVGKILLEEPLSNMK